MIEKSTGKPILIASDLEGVLIPEVWINFAKKTILFCEKKRFERAPQLVRHPVRRAVRTWGAGRCRPLVIRVAGRSSLRGEVCFPILDRCVLNRTPTPGSDLDHFCVSPSSRRMANRAENKSVTALNRHVTLSPPGRNARSVTGAENPVSSAYRPAG